MADSKSRHQVEAVGAGRAQAGSGHSVVGPWPRSPAPRRGQLMGSAGRSLPRQERESMTGLGECPGPHDSRLVSEHLNLLPGWSLTRDICIEKPTAPPCPGLIRV